MAAAGLPAAALVDGLAWATGHLANALKAPTMVIDLNTYKPPEELRVKLDDVRRCWWDEGLQSGISIFATNRTASNGAHEGENGENGNGLAPPPAAIGASGEPAHPLQSASSEESQAGTGPPAERQGKLDPVAEDILNFQAKVFKKAGLSEDGTYLPKSIHPKHCKNNPQTDLASSMEECKMAVCGAVEGLLQKLNLRADQIDILVTTCSIYCPTPSMASMVVNAFKMRSDIYTCHLGGMGCANGVIAVNLVRDLLKTHPNSNALLVCNETTTPALYRGKDKHRLVTNVLFRMGASAILLSNKRSWVRSGKAKYVLTKALRVHLGARDDAYKAIHYSADDEGINGIYLGKNVVTEATAALTIAMHKAGAHLLTWWQLLQAAWYYIQKYMGLSPAPFKPSFAAGVQHFLIHAGGAKVLDGIGTSLKLNETHLEPSRAVLYDYGNVSSSTTWYTLSFIEAVRGVNRGDKVLQIGVGSGIKCGVNVWKAMRNIDDLEHPAWEHRITDKRRVAALARQSSVSAFQVLLVLSILVALLALVLQQLGFTLPLP